MVPKEPASKAPEATPANPSSDSRAIFDKAMASARAKETPVATPGQGETPLEDYFSKKPDPTEHPAKEKDPAAKPAKKNTEAEKASESTKPKANSPEYEKARAELKLNGWVDKALDALEPEEAVKIHGKLLEREASVRRAFNERAELQKELDALKATKKPEPEAAPTGDLDLSEAVQKIQAEFGEDVGDVLSKLIESNRALQGEVSKMREERESDTARSVKSAIEKAAGELTGDYPSLADVGVMSEVQAEMAAIANHPRYREMGLEESAMDAMRRAIRSLEIPAKAAEVTQEPEDEEASPRRQPRTASRKTAAKKASSGAKEHDDRATFDRVMAEARAAAS